jgi:hypothetical protein
MRIKEHALQVMIAHVVAVREVREVREETEAVVIAVGVVEAALITTKISPLRVGASQLLPRQQPIL